jgi:hypothetical protein
MKHVQKPVILSFIIGGVIFFCGKKLMYVNEYFVRATVAGVTNNNYGQGIRRLLVDTEGLSQIAEVVFLRNKTFCNDFLTAVRRQYQ